MGEYKVLDFLRSDILRQTPTLGMVEKGMFKLATVCNISGHPRGLRSSDSL